MTKRLPRARRDTERTRSAQIAHRVRDHLRGDARLVPGAGMVVAVSGGADSVALLLLLVAAAPEAGLGLVVAHLDHGLRGGEGVADAEFVRSLAESLGLPFRTTRVDAAASARREKRSLEDAARRERGRFLEEVRRASGAAVVALGHTRDDQAETLLLNLLRGAGPRGLGAMPPYGPDALTRPLLGVTRAEAVAELEALGQTWRTDASNDDPRFSRNRIRHDLLPWLRAEFNPAIVDTLARSAELFRALDAFLEATAVAWLTEPAHRRRGPRDLALRVSALRATPEALRDAILRRAAAETGGLRDWGQIHSEALAALLAAPEEGGLDLPGGRRALRAGPWLRLAPADDVPRPTEAGTPPREWPAQQLPSEVRGETATTPRGILRLTRVPTRRAAPLPLPEGRAAAFDARGFPARIEVRPLRPGDRLRGLNAPGARKVVDLLADKDVPVGGRIGWPVVTPAPRGGGKDGEPDPPLLWVPGVRRGRDFPVEAETCELIILEWFGDPAICS